jgi:hypothetical protein
MEVTAIPTMYYGYRFRSRLEARYAVLFTTLGLKWKYEHEGFYLDGLRYLPDFWFPERKWFADVKGEEPGSDDMEKMYRLAAKAKRPLFVLVGTPGDEDQSTRCLGGDVSVTVRANLQHHCLKGTLFPELRGGDWEDAVRCPLCNCLEVHQSDAVAESPLDIPMWCENGHQWSLRIETEKGRTFMSIVAAQTEERELVVFADGDSKRLAEAVIAARSARFEHGECGAPSQPSYRKPSRVV